MFVEDAEKVDHFVITRFNLKIHFEKDKNGKATQTEAWLKRRFDLFETYCFPSLRGQTCQNFKWLMLFDVDTPTLYKEKIETYKKAYSNICPLYLETGDSEYMRKYLKNAIQAMSDKHATRIITTRIDNDDAFNVHMINDVQNKLADKTDCFLNYNYGVQFDISACVGVLIRYERNHFISRIENNNSSLETVITHCHTQIDMVSNVIAIDDKNNPMWVEIVHESNIGNCLRLSMPIFSDKYFNRFNMKVSIDKKRSAVVLIKYIKTEMHVYTSSVCKKLLVKIGLLEEFMNLIRWFRK